MANWFGATFTEIRSKTKSEFIREVVGELSSALAFRVLQDEQMRAWSKTAEMVFDWASFSTTLPGDWLVLMEYSPPLVTTRPDIIFVTNDSVIVCEVKDRRDEVKATGTARRQALGYASDLYWFHPGTRGRTIQPVVVLNVGTTTTPQNLSPDDVPAIESVGVVTWTTLEYMLSEQAAREIGTVCRINYSEWLQAQYRPRPNIVDAAVALVASAEDPGVTAALSDDEELHALTQLLVEQVHEAASKRDHRMLIVTGVPGAGKTLVGLRLAHDPSVVDRLRGENEVPLYLTGNGPLVAVLTEALARDFRIRLGVSAVDARRRAGVLVKLVHSFTREGLEEAGATDVPGVSIFDEGQRVWDQVQMSKKHVIPEGQSLTEPDVILNRLSKREWAVVVVLVGSGQEINTGEAGAELWLDSITRTRDAGGRKWIGLAPPELCQNPREGVESNPFLALRRTRRSVGAAWLSEWVEHVLSGDTKSAAALAIQAAQTDEPYPLLMTRELQTARVWLRTNSERSRSGLVASSRSARLRPYGIETSADFQGGIDWPCWFLDHPPSLRSSSALEVAATEFKCQGLELDYVGLIWSWDMIRSSTDWITRRLTERSASWATVDKDRRRFQINAYRVLLTRARAGMVVIIPEGSHADKSRNPKEMDDVAQYLLDCGMTSLK
jgi:hypothetical protein